MAEEKIKISELTEASSIQDGCCIPLVQDSTTKKIYYSTLLSKIIAAVEDSAEIDWSKILNKPLTHETWTFTLESGSTVTKEVTLWNSAT